MDPVIQHNSRLIEFFVAGHMHRPGILHLVGCSTAVIMHKNQYISTKYVPDVFYEP